MINETSVSHDGEYEDDCLLGCCAVIALIMEAASTSETTTTFADEGLHGATTQKTAIFIVS
jgi:hypothetical protein